MKWFHVVKNMNELRKQYKKLLLKHHPDNEGKVSDMQEINAEYDLLFDRLKAETKSYGETRTYNENEENKAFKEVLNVIIGYRMEIEIIGKWIWCFQCFSFYFEQKNSIYRSCHKSNNGSVENSKW
ncbi:MAG: DnaJ domain protein [Clostridiales bacterium]|jgi:curved DNA-binding protein CbpA|nr:DnaJ domain protein [Clostridiales bacterium]